MQRRQFLKISLAGTTFALPALAGAAKSSTMTTYPGGKKLPNEAVEAPRPSLAAKGGHEFRIGYDFEGEFNAFLFAPGRSPDERIDGFPFFVTNPSLVQTVPAHAQNKTQIILTSSKLVMGTAVFNWLRTPRGLPGFVSDTSHLVLDLWWDSPSGDKERPSVREHSQLTLNRPRLTCWDADRSHIMVDDPIPTGIMLPTDIMQVSPSRSDDLRGTIVLHDSTIQIVATTVPWIDDMEIELIDRKAYEVRQCSDQQ